MSDIGFTPSRSPSVCSPRKIPPAPSETTVEVVDVRPEAPPVLRLAPHSAGASVSLRVPGGLLAVPNTSKRVPHVSEGLQIDVQMPSVATILPPAAIFALERR